MTEITMSLSPIEAMDAALNGYEVDVIDRDGSEWPFIVDRWLTIGADDHELFVRPCSGLTIDVGCGPGRLTAGLAAQGVCVVGIDVSSEAIRRTRFRGVAAQKRDIFEPIAAAGMWDYALLADGNIGIGGDPIRLLRRVRQLINPTGTILVELSPPGTGITSEEYRFRFDGCESSPFAWSRVGSEAIAGVATQAGLQVNGIKHATGRYVAALSPSILSGPKTTALRTTEP